MAVVGTNKTNSKQRGWMGLLHQVSPHEHHEADVPVHQAMARCLFRNVVIASGYDGATPSESPESSPHPGVPALDAAKKKF
jgi:hypothetical protein